MRPESSRQRQGFPRREHATPTTHPLPVSLALWMGTGKKVRETVSSAFSSYLQLWNIFCLSSSTPGAALPFFLKMLTKGLLSS